MKIREIQEEILRLKKERDFCILAHSYQTSDILEIADFTGDSYALSVKAKNTPQKNVLMCGVRFMAETVKILSPEKNVYLSNPTAGCPMAEQMDKEMIRAVKMQYPDHTVVAYINTTAELKTICDVCVTSSSAVKIVSQLSNDKILFIPDCNLGAYVQQQLPDKKLKLLQAAAPSTHLYRRRMSALPRRRTRMRCCWYIRSAVRQSVSRRIISVPLPASSTMPWSRMQRNLSSAQRSALRRHSRMPARKSGSIRWQRN